MNNSGKSVKSLTTHYPLQTTNLGIVHDDIDLPVGKIKIVKERGSAGHKGVESIIKSIGNEGLIRIRIGIGGQKDENAMKVVLKNFSGKEKTIINETIKQTAKALKSLIENGLDKTMNEFN
jgi:PTH1 family peptidyl-tRNA hydrolase